MMYHKSLSAAPQTHTADAEMLIEESKLRPSVEKFKCHVELYTFLINSETHAWWYHSRRSF